MPDLVILDLLLPGLSGLDVCRALRAASTVPILVLSARGEEQTKVQALDLGADDYLTKPFGMDELLARVRALLRRLGASSTAGTLQIGALVVDLDARQAWRDGQALDLTPREFDVLAYLMRHAGKVVTHRRLLAEVWGPQYKDETQYLRVFVNRLRAKIGDDPAHPRYIATEPGVGYRVLPA
jgi:two-component system KDP operon response regulator KdpE